MVVEAEALILGADPYAADGLRRSLEGGGPLVRCRIVPEEALPEAAAPPGAGAIVASPREWRDLARWLSVLPRELRPLPWVLVAERQVAGLFLSAFEGRICSLVPSNAHPEALRATFRGVLEGCPLMPLSSLLELFAAHAARLSGGRLTVRLTGRELDLGCGVSLGLTNAQIGALLHMATPSVSRAVYDLRRKVRKKRREEVARLFEQALGR
jgi:DNA-binding NarL/FixJ family response regulator